ncbi:citryl-CoA lyase [Ramlibacter sp. USB13]|uniref:citrate synthase (unknown stereospecificity) n=1 Tax=Ramlibacter cellulosilyticus TaxID=2764187 RepID=A0A923SC26_9BURK|nr:citryl-CoA lyase [Ramlibacter cellulosilyticus]MBC5784464.1 citryl-CoA lyase [Ramlibacter cellulosilyticus]
MSKTPGEIVDEAKTWWTTEIVDIQPGKIGIRGYPIQQLIGNVSFPEMIWLMLRGEVPRADQAKLLEAALVAAVDHGPHAPSIAISRMAVTCGLPINGAMASAINALDDIHGGAGQQCMELLQEIDQALAGSEPSIEVVEAVLASYVERNGKIIPGFGHRWHGTDPRAVRLVAIVREAQARGTVAGRYTTIATLVEEALGRKKGTRIPMNIDGITAAIYLELGFPAPLGRGLFILSRSVGILSHAWEQSQQGGRIKGPMPPSVSYTYAGPAARDLKR